MVTTRTFGNAGRPSSPGPAPEYPNAAAFSGVSGASHSNPSIDISRQTPRNAPAVSSSVLSVSVMGLALSGTVDILLLLALLVFVRPAWVKEAGEAYAERLLGSLENL